MVFKRVVVVSIYVKKGGYGLSSVSFVGARVLRIRKYWYPSASVTLVYPAFEYSIMRFCVSGVPVCMAIVMYSSGSSRLMVCM